MNIKALFMLSSTTLMSGCASMLSIGETDYACRGLPGDPLCASVHDVYEASSTSNYQQGLQTLRDRKKAERDEGEDSSLFFFDDEEDYRPSPVSASNGVNNEPVVEKAGVIEVSYTPNHLVTPQVKEVVKKRVWIAPWISSKGVNYDQQHVYIKHNPAWQDQEALTVDNVAENKSGKQYFQPLYKVNQ